jgi:hypothetical protein
MWSGGEELEMMVLRRRWAEAVAQVQREQTL